MKEHKYHLRQEQLEVLKELGYHLYLVRSQKCISLEEVARITCIRVSLLRAIEEGNLDALPESVYIQGLIKQFADALDLNGREFARAFPTEDAISISPSRWLSLPFIQLRPFHLYFLYIFVVMGAVSSLSHLVQRSEVPVAESLNQELPEQKSPVSPTSTQVSQPSIVPPESTTTTFTAQKSEEKPVVVGITLQDRSWLRVVVDGETKFEGILEGGTQRTWTAERQLTVRAGNAGGVLVAFNHQQAKQLGARGQVQEVTYSPQ